ncbi:MAG: magnesium transporter MgtE N-terminal domain-containing protein [Pyrinomonadaceae bacterium]
MVMLTELLRFEVRDASGARAAVSDLSIALLDDDHPPVTHVIFTDKHGKTRRTEWARQAPVEIDERGRVLRVRDLGDADEFDVGECSDVLLRRDIMDALILDLLGRRTTRVCDLLMEQDEADGELRVKAADAGLAAMFRRVTRGRIGPVDRESMFDWKYVEFLRGDPHAVDNGAGYRLRINRLPAGEIARLADYVPYLHAAELIRLLPDEKAADVLEAMSVARQLQVIEELDDDEAVELICLMSPDLATDLIGRVQLDTMKRWLDLMPRQCRERIVALLRYPEASVGGVMVNDIIVVPARASVREAQQIVRGRLREASFASVIFVVGDDGGVGGRGQKLCGAMALKELFAADESLVVSDAMDPYLEALGPFDSASEAAYRIVSGQLSAMPVVDEQGSLIGAMTISHAIAQLVPRSSDLQTLRVFA